MSENSRYWDKLRIPPVTALKAIQAGRLKGKSDINPQWRLQAMTETFGPCGIGWKYTIDKLWLERGLPVKCKEADITLEEVAAFALVSVYYKDGENWSEPIPGIGGSMFSEIEKYGPFNSDEAFKMAVTDALSVAFKAIGVAAEVYLGNFDGGKYNQRQAQGNQQAGNYAAQAPPKPAYAGKPEGATLTEAQTKYFPRVKAALDALYGDDTATKKAEIKLLTTFPEKKDGKETGKMIAGVEDYRVLDGKRLEILCHKLEQAVQSDKDR